MEFKLFNSSTVNTGTRNELVFMGVNKDGKETYQCDGMTITVSCNQVSDKAWNNVKSALYKLMDNYV